MKNELKENNETKHSKNSYYQVISRRFGKAQTVLFSLLFAVGILAVILNHKSITFRNFYYLLKDLKASAESGEVLSTDTLGYLADENQSFALYRNGLAVVGNKNISLFTAAGKQSLHQEVDYANPMLCGDGKYLLVYDLGGKAFSLWNSYSPVYSGSMEDEIRDAAILQNGIFAICTEGTFSASEVHIYNKNFEKIAKYSFDRLVNSISFNEDGNRFTVLLSYFKEETYYSQLECFTVGEQTPIFSYEMVGTLGLRAKLNLDESTSVICKDFWCLISSAGEKIAEFQFEGREILSVSMKNEGTAFLFTGNTNNGEKYAIVFDKSGKMLYNNQVNDSTSEVLLSGGSLFLKNPDGIIRVCLSDGAVAFCSCNTENSVMLSSEENGVFLCGKQKAVYYRIYLK